MKRLLILLPLFMLLISCADTRYSTQFFGYFDTIISLDGYFESEKAFNDACEIVEDTLKEYDDIFDIYDNGELKKLNEQKKLTVSDELKDALSFGIEAEKITDGACNIAMGSVLSIWHNAREALSPYLPNTKALQSAGKHIDISLLEINNNEVKLRDEEMTIDLGAIAKGYVSNILRERLTEAGYNNLYVNLGGNVMAMGDKKENGWKVGVQSPFDDGGIIHSVDVKDSCLVTSGVYQRYFEVDGKRYHHIISPETLFPSENYLSISVLYKDGAWADALSTALFNMSIDEGKSLLERFDGILVIWITSNGEKIIYENK